jgi:hypothetical protein
MSEEWIVREFVRTRYTSGPGEEEMFRNQKKVFGPSVVLGRGCKNLCRDSQRRERRKRKKIKNKNKNKHKKKNKKKKKILKKEKVHILFKRRKLCNDPLRTNQQDTTS